MKPRSAVIWTGIPNSSGKWEPSWHFSGFWWKMKSRLSSRSYYSLSETPFSLCNHTLKASRWGSLNVNRAVLTIILWLEQGFASTLIQGIDFRVQDIEYKLGLVRQDFTREVKYAHFYVAQFPAFPTLFADARIIAKTFLDWSNGTHPNRTPLLILFQRCFQHTAPQLEQVVSTSPSVSFNPRPL